MRPQKSHGLLVIDKPSGMTSRAVVNRVQRWFPRGTRIGHTGTLDPLATGVLVLCVGVATRLVEYVQAMPKSYQAGLLLGAQSDTDDMEGSVTQVDVEQVPDLPAIDAGLQSFVGEVDQVPPNFSAVKLTGRRACDLARRGRVVTLQPRKVTIYGIDILYFDYPRLEVEVRCGKGTYIRSLARDLGDKLGCGALIETLRRTRVGPFIVEDALPLDVGDAVARARLLPVEAAVSELPRVVVDQETASALGHGRGVEWTGEDHIRAGACAICAVFDTDGQLIGVGTWDGAARRLTPTKVVAEQ
jgi:tRNA pseudouridine55 synthase